MARIVRIELATIMAAILAILAFSRIGESRASHVIEERNASPAEESNGGSETAIDAVQPTDEDPVASGTDLPTSGAPRARQGASSSKGAQSAESHPPGPDSPSNETAGPWVFYLDQADDAHGQQGAPPNAALSQREFDILRVDWAPVSYVSEESPGGYSTSMTVAGSVRDDNAMYVSWGRFGRDCRLYHFLIPRTTAYANAFCDSAGGWGFVGRVKGGPVTSTPTSSGGILLSATFDNRSIPAPLAAARTLHNLAAYTCTGRIDEPLNVCDGYLDWANSSRSYRV